MTTTMICVDALTLQYPETIGLEDIDLLGHENTAVFSSAIDARCWWKSQQQNRQAWIVSCDDMDAINLAATLKHDTPHLPVFLVDDGLSHEAQALAQVARIDGTKSVDDLACALYQAQEEGAQPLRGLHAKETPRLVQDDFLPETPYREDLEAAHVPNEGALSEPDTATRPVPDEDPASPDPIPPQAASGRAVIVPVISGSGGSGKSTITVACAMVAARRGLRTLIIDGDLQFGDTHITFGLGNPTTLDDVLDNPAELTRISTQSKNPALIASLRNPEQAETAIAGLPQILDELQGSFDLILVNTGSFWTEEHALLLERCTKAFVTIDQRPSSLRACRRALEICSHCGIATSPLLFVVNRCCKGSLYSSIDASCGLKGMPAFEVKDGGPEVEELLAVGQPYDLFNLHNGFMKSIERLLQTVLPLQEDEDEVVDEPAAHRKPWGLFSLGNKEEGE